MFKVNQIKHCSHLSKLDTNSEASCGDPPLCLQKQAYPAPDTQRQIKPETRSHRHTHTHTICPKLSRSQAPVPSTQKPCRPALLLATPRQQARMQGTAGCTLRPASAVSPSLKSEERAWVSSRGLHGLWMGDPHHAEQGPGERHLTGSLYFWERREVTSYKKVCRSV